MKRHRFHLLWAVVPVVLVLVLSGCNTVKGVGDDMSAAGEAISKEADKNKNY
jgi:predicted small secreted protein